MSIITADQEEVLFLTENVVMTNGKTLPYYGSLPDADNYFRYRLDNTKWINANDDRKLAALIMSTRAIDNLDYMGVKLPDSPLAFPRTEDVYNVTKVIQAIQLVEMGPTFAPDDDESAEAAPTIPVEIVQACYENALALLKGVNPDTETDNLDSTSRAYGSLRTTYDRSSPGLHYIHGIASPTAWRMIQPFLRDTDTVILKRV